MKMIMKKPKKKSKFYHLVRYIKDTNAMEKGTELYINVTDYDDLIEEGYTETVEIIKKDVDIKALRRARELMKKKSNKRGEQ